jgi:pyruvate dehydrogenase E2 component (dihydrolipoamide acetyltransferase)
VALLFTGAIVKKPAVINDPEIGDVVAIRSMCYVGLTYDHRVIDGADAARFLATVKQRIEDAAFTASLGLS